jgi:hypothetical protein
MTQENIMKKVIAILALCFVSVSAFAETDSQIAADFVSAESSTYPYVEGASYQLLLFYNARSSFGLSMAAEADVINACVKVFPSEVYNDQHRYNAACLVQGIENAKAARHGSPWN